MKKYYKTFIIIIVILLVSFSIRFKINDSYINNFNEQNYVEWKVKILNYFNFYQPYIAVKNYGDYYHKQAEYDKALEKYDKALTYNMPKTKACDTRINACLTIFKQIDLKKTKQAKELLNKAKKYVDDDDCISLSSSDSVKEEDKKSVYKLLEDNNYMKLWSKTGVGLVDNFINSLILGTVQEIEKN